MDDHTTGRRRAGDDRPQRPDGAGTAVAAPVSRDAGEQPPDVIDVVFPAAADTGGTAAGPDRRERLRDRPLLLGSLAIAAVGLAAVIAWQVWPQPPGPTAPEQPEPRPTSSRPVGDDGISGRAAPPLPSSERPRTSRSPAADERPSRTPSASVSPTAGAGTPSPALPAGPPTATAGTTTAPTSAPPTPRTLRSGDSGSDVTDLQRLLFAQGFTYVALTGLYDDATVRGVTQVQKDRGLTCDPYGVYGPCTRAALTS
ncbi:peptidoglycan-binding domain-containing protein [Actinacidiphila alni]|nr:peptidoglycan-binding domain-containing protein [Actinacidiphila alni]